MTSMIDEIVNLLPNSFEYSPPNLPVKHQNINRFVFYKHFISNPLLPTVLWSTITSIFQWLEVVPWDVFRFFIARITNKNEQLLCCIRPSLLYVDIKWLIASIGHMN